jgi:CRP-like cAMP-binding protein
MTTSPLVLKLSRGTRLTLEDCIVLEAMGQEAKWTGPHVDLIREGQQPEFVHIVLEGFACRYKVLADGGRQIIALLVPGDFCDLHVAILGEMDHAIGTITACKIARLPYSTVTDITTNHPRITRAMWWATLVDEGILREWLVGMGRRPADKRLAHLVCELMVRLQTVNLATESGFALPLTQADLADVLGLTLVHVNRVLQQLRAEGLLGLKEKQLVVADLPRLKAFADFDPNYLHLKPRRELGD